MNQVEYEQGGHGRPIGLAGDIGRARHHAQQHMGREARRAPPVATRWFGARSANTSVGTSSTYTAKTTVAKS